MKRHPKCAAFCASHDLKELRASAHSGRRDQATQCMAVTTAAGGRRPKSCDAVPTAGLAR
eukprot:361463-Chlamydomonas_euryale.AAC.3